MTLREFAAWQAYDKHNPVGDERFDRLHSLSIMHLYAATAAKSKTFHECHYFPPWMRDAMPSRQSDEEMLFRFRLIAAVSDRRFKGNGK